MSEQYSPIQARFMLNPIYWPLWLGMGLLRLCILLPLSTQQRLAKILGWCGMLLMTERRRITRTNLRMCFPELNKAQLRKLVRESFYSSSMTLFETALSWWGKDAFFKQYSHIEGLEHVETAKQQNKGILLLGAHYTTLEIGGRVSMQFFAQITPTFKPAKNKLFNAFMVSSRRRIHGDMIQSNNLREILKQLKQRKVFWYAPDQDFGTQGTIFAPFMGVQTVTLTATARIAKSSNAVVLPWYSERLPNAQGYKITIGAAFENFPSGDDVLDATAINQSIEKQVRRLPAQYFWGHRRFKSRPAGEPLVYYPRRNSILKRYSLLLGALTLPAITYLLVIAIKFKDRNFFTQRLGLGPYPTNIDIWLHAASVGEINAVLPLIKLIQEQHPQLKILLTTNTPSGFANAKQKLPHIELSYLPIDLHLSVKHFIDQTCAKLALIVETEIWPNLYEYACWKGVDLIMINGRLSAKTTVGSRLKGYILIRTLQFVHFILARSEHDEQAFLKLDVKPEQQIKTLGNIKWAATRSSPPHARQLSKPYILAASTRDAEEKLITRAFLNSDGLDHILVIIPRHPKRIQQIISDLNSLNISYSVHSLKQAVTEDTRVYVVDTFGELQDYIAGSEFVIMGGSFEEFGGQNIIEVAQLGKAVIFGPHMTNFLDEASSFMQHHAGLSISTEQLCESINRLIKDRPFRQQLEKNATNLAKQYADIAEVYYRELQKLTTILN